MRHTARSVETSASTIIRWRDSSNWSSRKTDECKRRRRSLRRSNLRTGAVIALNTFYGHDSNYAATIGVARSHLASLGIHASRSTVHRWMRRDLGFTRKRISSKVLGEVTSEQIREYAQRRGMVVDLDTLIVSLDECHFSERIVPLYGYSPAGQRVTRRRSARGGWTAHSLILAIASDGTMFHNIKQGSVSRDCFGEFVLDMPFPPGTVILMDNCSIHKKLTDVFEAKGYIPLFLSPYSPNFQPVELAFSKVKQSFRSKHPWVSGVMYCVDECVANINSSDIDGFFRHADRELISALATHGVFQSQGDVE